MLAKLTVIQQVGADVVGETEGAVVGEIEGEVVGPEVVGETVS